MDHRKMINLRSWVLQLFMIVFFVVCCEPAKADLYRVFDYLRGRTYSNPKSIAKMMKRKDVVHYQQFSYQEDCQYECFQIAEKPEKAISGTLYFFHTRKNELMCFDLENWELQVLFQLPKEFTGELVHFDFLSDDVNEFFFSIGPRYSAMEPSKIYVYNMSLNKGRLYDAEVDGYLSKFVKFGDYAYCIDSVPDENHPSGYKVLTYINRVDLKSGEVDKKYFQKLFERPDFYFWDLQVEKEANQDERLFFKAGIHSMECEIFYIETPNGPAIPTNTYPPGVAAGGPENRFPFKKVAKGNKQLEFFELMVGNVPNWEASSPGVFLGTGGPKISKKSIVDKKWLISVPNSRSGGIRSSFLSVSPNGEYVLIEQYDGTVSPSIRALVAVDLISGEPLPLILHESRDDSVGYFYWR